MLKMLIVEDERWEREGLVEFLDWESMNISSIDTAFDGIDGLEKAIEGKPDIVVTDIQMPGRNGIEMSKLILEHLPEVKIVVLTGYDDFGYAREALRFGAVDYVLKPVVEEEMRNTMLKVVQSCEEIKWKRNAEARLWKDQDAVRLVSLRQRFSDLLLNRINDESKVEIIEELRQSGYLDAPLFSVWVFSLTNSAYLPDMIHLENAAEKVLQRRTLIHSNGEGARTFFAAFIPLQKDELYPQEQLAVEFLKVLETTVIKEDRLALEQSENVGWTLCINLPRGNIDNIIDSYRESQNTLNYAIFNEKFGIIEATEVQHARQHFAKSSEEFTHHFQELAKRLKHNIGSGGQTDLILNELFSFLAAHPGAGRSYVATLLGGLVESLSSLAKPSGKGITPAGKGHFEALLTCERLQDMKLYVSAFIEDSMLLLEEKRYHKDDYLVYRVIQLIEEHYGKPDLSLAFLADEVYVSPNHLGMIFKKKTGKTPIEYVQEFRLERAEELLRTTKQRVGLVAEQIGIPNASYFGLLFKQIYGMTPGEYREFVKR